MHVRIFGFLAQAGLLSSSLYLKHSVFGREALFALSLDSNGQALSPSPYQKALLSLSRH